MIAALPAIVSKIQIKAVVVEGNELRMQQG
jgi:hypothetical protein